MKKIFVIIGAVVLFAGIFLFAVFREKGNTPLIYSDNTDRVILTTEGREFTLRDLAFYIGFQEKKVDEQAQIYDPEHPANYWNTHTNGKFLKVLALESAMDMMLHDWYYSKMAEGEGLALNEEEKELASDAAADYVSDLGEEGLKALGISEEEVSDTCKIIALSEKYIQGLSEASGRDTAVFECGGIAWDEEKEKLKLRYDEELKRRIPMGKITLEY
jgi:hypothetical protein